MTLVRIGLFSDAALSVDEANRFLAARQAKISELEEAAKRLPSYYSKPMSEWTEEELADMRKRAAGRN
jgi:hypothetical protein